MRVLIGCEFSQIVTKAFRDRGHDAYSCDLLPTEGNPDWHFQEDIFEVLGRESQFDLGIFHPPCTYLSNAGIRWFNEERYGDKARHRKVLRLEALDFFVKLYNAPIPKIAIENPVGYANSQFRKPDQIVQPYYFGDAHLKNLCFWLKNLPLLRFDKAKAVKPEPLGVTLRKPSKYYKGGEEKKHYFTQLAPTRGGHERSVTFPGIANALAAQWSEYLLTK